MNIYEFFQKSVDALQQYILIHYDRQTWFKQWVGLSDVGNYFKSCEGSLGSPYFHFEWAGAAYYHMAENWTLYRCPRLYGRRRREDMPGMRQSRAVALAVDEAYEYLHAHRIQHPGAGAARQSPRGWLAHLLRRTCIRTQTSTSRLAWNA